MNKAPLVGAFFSQSIPVDCLLEMNMSKHEPIHESSAFMGGGRQAIYRFDNGYGASVIRTPYSYGGRNGKSRRAT